jgi:hypothetical protein
MRENMDKKTKLQRFFHGVRLGIKLSLLPKSIERFHLHPLTRIFRVLGGISFILIIGKFIARGSLLFYFIFPLAVLQLIYIMFISTTKFCYFIYLWKNNKLEVRNSPLDKIATIGLNLVACVKGTCQYGIYGGAALGLGLSIDELLLNFGREPVFRDALGSKLDKILTSLGYENPSSNVNEPLKEAKILKYKLEQLKVLNKDIEEINVLGNEVGANDSELIREIKEDISRKIEKEKRSIIESRSNILSQLSEKNGGKNPFAKK